MYQSSSELHYVLHDTVLRETCHSSIPVETTQTSGTWLICTNLACYGVLMQWYEVIYIGLDTWRSGLDQYISGGRIPGSEWSVPVWLVQTTWLFSR